MKDFDKLLNTKILREAALESLVDDMVEMMNAGSTIEEMKKMYPGVNQGCLNALKRKYKQKYGKEMSK